jgi:hypothetical protein
MMTELLDWFFPNIIGNGTLGWLWSRWRGK